MNRFSIFIKPMFSYYSTNIAFDGLTPGQLLMLAALSMDDLSWDHYLESETALYARANMGLFSWGERISVTTLDEHAVIVCKQPIWRLFKRQQPGNDVTMLVEYMQHNRTIYSPETLQAELESIRTSRSQKRSATEKIVMGRYLPKATAALILINLLCFMVVGYYTGSLLTISVMDIFNWGGNIRLHTLGGEGWRLLTSCFLHSGPVHLVGNMVVLFIIGRLLEPLLGPWLFTLVYLCAGVLGSLLSVMVAGNRISVGASGAIFGMYGVFIALLTTNLLTGETRNVLFKSIFLFIIYGLFSGMAEKIDNASHMGGLLSGFVFGYIIFFGYGSLKATIVASLAISVLTLTIVFLVLYLYHNDTVKYDRMLNRMQQLESDAQPPPGFTRTGSREVQLAFFTSKARPAWQQLVRIADSAKDFRFGNQRVYSIQKGMLLRYGQHRIAENEIRIRALQTGDSMITQKDSIRMLIQDLSDSLRALRR